MKKNTKGVGKVNAPQGTPEKIEVVYIQCRECFNKAPLINGRYTLIHSNTCERSKEAEEITTHITQNPEPISAQIEGWEEVFDKDFRWYFDIDSNGRVVDALNDELKDFIRKILSTAHSNGYIEGAKAEAAMEGFIEGAESMKANKSYEPNYIDAELPVITKDVLSPIEIKEIYKNPPSTLLEAIEKARRSGDPVLPTKPIKFDEPHSSCNHPRINGIDSYCRDCGKRLNEMANANSLPKQEPETAEEAKRRCSSTEECTGCKPTRKPSSENK